MKKAALYVSLLAFLVPVATHAQTVEQLRAQIDQLMQRVAALQQSVGTPSVPGAATGGQCPLISRTLKLGMSGEDVTRLQQFLASDVAIYPEGTVSGYYGALTQAAVKRFQCKFNIVCSGTPDSTGYGIVGPRTAAILALQCAGGGTATPSGPTNPGGFIQVSPTSGAAPLAVSILATVNTTRSCAGGTYEVLLGDGSPTRLINVPSGGCGELRQTLTHIYTTAGTYQVTLRAGAHSSTATVTVGGSGSTGGGGTNTGSDTFKATPASGAASLNVSFTGVANASGSCTPATYRVQFGDNTNDANIPVSNCSVSTYAITHGYNSAGSYRARLFRGSSEVGAYTIEVTGAGGNAPGGGTFTVMPGHGGDAFAVLATFQLASACTAYDVDWGDNTTHATQASGTCAAGQVSREVSHTYSGSGTYTITLKRGSGSGQTTDTVGVSVVY